MTCGENRRRTQRVHEAARDHTVDRTGLIGTISATVSHAHSSRRLAQDITMLHDLYTSISTPVSRRRLSVQDASAVEDIQTASQIDRVLQMESDEPGGAAHRVQFNGVTTSDRSSRVSRSEMGRSLARVYEPSLQERAQHFLEGPSGLYLELINLACSITIFALYIIELYNPNLEGATLKRIVELGLTSFFIFDLGLHLFVAPNPFQYLFSIYGVIDIITIIPSFLMYFVNTTKSQTFFILRVLRIFRALRVLRLKRFIKFKRHGFNYELSVFILSAVAVILCAAGMYHAMEESYYTNEGDNFYFHQSLYFILVTMSTVGYGDISPHTTVGEIFVMILIVAAFTIVPQKAAKLNQLAKQNHAFDKDYTRRSSRRTGHVVVSGYDLTTDSILDFLNEFYHSSRGNIHLDVVFMCEAAPSSTVLRLLSTDKYLQRTRYLRGSLSNGNDQRRAKLGEATAVFFLANKLFRRESAQQDARTVLHTLAVRNFADSCGVHLDIYTQLRSYEHELEMTAQLLGSNTTNTSELQTMILSRAAVCPGASTLILNLLHSVNTAEYADSHKVTKNWIEEYIDGMSYQIFPIIFTRRFKYEKYDDVVQNIYQHYRAMLIMVRPRRRRRSSNGSPPREQEFCVAPFHTYIREGDIGIVLAKTAASVLHIVNSYGYWNEGDSGRNSQSPRQARPVRVSSDSLMKRPSPRSRLQTSAKSTSSLLEQSRSVKGSDIELTTTGDVTELSDISHRQTIKYQPTHCSRVSSFSNLASLEKMDESLPPSATSGLSEQLPTMPIILHARSKSKEDVEACLKRDHFVHHTRHLDSHFVICGGRLRDALSIVASVRRFCERESRLRPTSRAFSQLGHVLRFSNSPAFALLVEDFPTGHDIVKVVHLKEEYGEDVSNLLHNVVFLCGSPSKVGDLRNVAVEQARRVIILPSPASISKIKMKPLSPHKLNPTSEASSLSHEHLTDFGVINALLVEEVVRDELTQQWSGRMSPKRRQSSRQHNSQSSDAADSSVGFFRRELEQGIPLESIKVRMLERYPDLEPKIFNQAPEVIEVALEQYDNNSAAIENGEQGSRDGGQGEDDNSDDINTIALLYHASSAKFCRPRDSAVAQDEFPFLAPSFASGDVLISSILDRILCQAFFNPYVPDIVRLLACGQVPPMGKDLSNSPSKPSSTPAHPVSRQHRLFQVILDDGYAGASFETVFQDFLAMDMLVISILRAANPALENLRPFVYTCPSPETTMHHQDRLFVLG